MYCYTAQYKVFVTAQNTLHFVPGQSVPLSRISVSLGRIQPHGNYCMKTTTYSQVLIHTAEPTGAMEGERNCPRSEAAARVFTSRMS